MTCICGHRATGHRDLGEGLWGSCLDGTCPCTRFKDDPIAPPAADMVNHPPHYTSHPSGVECIQVTEHQNFCIGNAIKYLWRCDGKNGLEDLKKARWYVDREIARREKAGA